MKLGKLSIRDVLAIKEVDIDFRQQTWLFGLNAAGKSAVREALTYVLTQTARGTDQAGKGAAALIRDGSELAQVRLDCTHDGHAIGIAAEIRPDGVALALEVDSKVTTGKAAQAMLAALLGPKELLQCLTDAEHVLTLSRAEQSELLSGLLGGGCTIEELRTKAEGRGLSPEAVAALIEGVGRRLPAGSSGVTPALLADAYGGPGKGAFGARTKANAELDRLKKAPVEKPLVTVATPPAEEIQGVRDVIALLEDTEATLRGEIGALGENVRGLEALKTEHARLAGELKPLVSATAPVQGALELAPDYAELKATAEAAKAAEKAANEASAHAAKEAAAAKGSADAQQKTIDEIKAGSVACDGMFAGAPCPVAQQNLGERQSGLPKLQAALGEARSREAEAVREREGRAKIWQEAAAKLTEANAAVQTEELRQAKAAGSGESRRAGLESRLADLAGRIEAAGDPATERGTKEQQLIETRRTLTEAQRTLANKEGVVAQQGKYETYCAELAAAQIEAKLFDELCKALEPRGLPLAILADKVDPFVTQVNATLEQLVEFRAGIDVGDGLSLTFTPLAGGRPRPSVLLSRSEQLRVGAALSIALAITSGLRFVVVDALDMLDEGNRPKFSGAAEALRSEMESVVLVSTVPAPPFGEDEGTGVYWIEGGIANAVNAAEEVPA